MDFQEYGFESAGEFFALVAKVDMSTPAKVAAFKAWQENDGTRAELQKLIDGDAE